MEYFQTLSYSAIPVIIFILGLAFIYREHLNHRANLMEKELALMKAAGTKGVASAPGVSPMITLRAQAYERLVLYLERINPDSLIMRLHHHGMSAGMLRNDLNKAIREEFDHNLSQQIYVSQEVWNQLVKAREETISLINIAHKKMDEKSTGLDMTRLIFSILSEVGERPNERALRALRDEARKVLS